MGRPGIFEINLLFSSHTLVKNEPDLIWACISMLRPFASASMIAENVETFLT